MSAANLHALYLIATQKLPSKVGTMESRGRLTLYSLYKQINESDADEVPGNRDVTSKVKYNAWLQQKGKDVDRCMMEYVAVFARYDRQFAAIVD